MKVKMEYPSGSASLFVGHARGETFEARWEKMTRDNIYCVVCCDWTPKDQLKIWTGDDMKHYLCPDCDSDLKPPEIME